MNPTFEIPNPLQGTALARPHHVVVEADDGEWTARDLAHTAALIAGALAACGATPTERIGVFGTPSREWVAAFHGIAWLGAAVAPLPLDATEAAKAVAALAVQRVIVVGTPPLPPWGDVVLHRVSDLLASAPNTPLPERFWPLDETRFVLRTSGTTGAPQPIAINTGQLVFGTFGSAIRYGHDLSDRWLCCMPLHLISGCAILWRAAWLGITVVLHACFDAERVAVALDRGMATLVSFTPPMWARVLDVRRSVPFPDTLRAVLLGAAPTTQDLIERSRAINAPIALVWGMSETAGQVATRFAGDCAVDGGVGVPLAFCRVAETSTGALEVRGPQTPSGSLITADMGTVDDEGRVHVVGRRDDVINSGGVKIWPGEIEAVLREHPAVADVVVFGVPHLRWIERPVAVVVLKNAIPTADLTDFCRNRLLAFKIPDQIVCRDAIPLTAAGKVSRKELRDWFITQQPHLPQPGLDGIRNGDLTKIGEVDRRVNQLPGRPEIVP